VSSHQLQRDNHLYGTKTANTAWPSGRTSICHDTGPQQQGSGSPKEKPKNSIHSLIYEAHITGSRTRGPSCAHGGLRLDFGIASVPVQES